MCDNGGNIKCEVVLYRQIVFYVKKKETINCQTI